MDPAVPELIAGRYRIERQLGRGGFATTWLAHDLETGRDVAAKVLDIKALDHWKSVELFEREARVLERLDHPRIPRYLDFVAPAESGPDAARMVLVQELAAGEPLSDRLAAGWRPTEPEVLAIARQVLDILTWLQAQSPPVVHRDIKPANLVMDSEGVVRLVDFGAVRDTVASQSRFGSTIVGSFGYMAPEQFQGDARPESDLYGLGATLVTLLTGKEPADLGHERMRLDFHAHVNVAEPVRDWLDRLLDPVADERFASAAVSLAALDAPAGSAGAPQSIRRQRAELWVEDAEFRVVVHSNMRVIVWFTIFSLFWCALGALMLRLVFLQPGAVLVAFPSFALGLLTAGVAWAEARRRIELRIGRRLWELKRFWGRRQLSLKAGRTEDLRGFDAESSNFTTGGPAFQLVLRERSGTHQVASAVPVGEVSWLVRELATWLARQRS
jgi:hypothetical protein